jgi:uncharacterized protein (TIGR03086 family)
MAAGLLELAAGYGLVSLAGIPPARLAAPTPCAGWNLRMLLEHLGESVTALREAADLGCVGVAPPAAPVPVVPAGGPAEVVADEIRRLVDGWTRAERRTVTVGGRPLERSVLEVVAALEIAVHGWDVATARGRPRPIPVGLALGLTRALPLVAGDLVRPGLFAAPVPASPLGSPGDRLVALLGRRPGRR